MAERETAIQPTRQADFPEWYQQVIKAADLAENSPVRGCMVIKPWGYGIWENVQREFDRRIKALGHENAYFPLFIPLSFLEKEAAHISGFAKVCAVVTHHRLEAKDGKLVPAGELEEPLIVRPTSETIIGEMFHKWVQSYRDLPLLINQWANVVRWEMRTRLFLRTTEFLWQEGHTVHVDETDARREVMTILEEYRSFAEDVLALPVIAGEKSANERFPGAVSSFTIEAMMQDGKALQAGTSHYLGTHFSKASDIRYLSQEGVQEYAHTTSWGISTRLIGGIIMAHGDDDGVRIPPRIAPKHVVILPIVPKPEVADDVYRYAQSIVDSLKGLSYHGQPLVVTVDKRDLRGGEKSWQWVKKGIPIRIEVGPRDIQSGNLMLSRRDEPVGTKHTIAQEALPDQVVGILDEIQSRYYQDALTYRSRATRDDITSFEELSEYFGSGVSTPGDEEDRTYGKGTGFVRAKWCGDPETASVLDPLKVSIRCLPLDQSGTSGACVLTGRPATTDVIFAKAY